MSFSRSFAPCPNSATSGNRARTSKPKLRPLQPGEAEGLAEMTSRIEDPKLKAALAAFGDSVLRRLPVTKR